MDGSTVVKRRRVPGRSRVSKPEQDKENRGRRPVRRKVGSFACNERKLFTSHLRQPAEMREGPLGHIHVKDGSKIPTFKARPICRRVPDSFRRNQTTVNTNQGLRNDLKVKVFNEAGNDVDARRRTRIKNIVDSKPLPSSPSEVKLHPEVKVISEPETVVDATRRVTRSKKMAPTTLHDAGVLDEVGDDVDVARRVTKSKNMEDIAPSPSSPPEGQHPHRVPPNTPTVNTSEGTDISDDVIAFLMRQVNDVLDVSMESDSSPVSHDGYESEILAYLREKESFISMRSVPIPPNIDPLHREILVDWLIDVQVHVELQNETLHLAVAMLDAYLLRWSISLHYLQLLGLTCLYLASKYEEVYFPNLDLLSKLCANAYKNAEFLIMERRILRTLDYDLFFPTAVDFLTRYLTAIDIRDERLIIMCNYLTDLTLLSCHSKFTCPSLWATTAIYVAHAVRKSQTRYIPRGQVAANEMADMVLEGRLQAVTGYDRSILTDLAKEMVEKVRAIQDSKYQASYRKYDTQMQHHISRELAKWCLNAEHLSFLTS